MRKKPDEVSLSRHNKIERWPVELAEQLLANPLPWGPPAYGFGGYIDDPALPDQSKDFFALASCVDEAYEHHGEDSWEWASLLLNQLKAGETCTQYSTQDLLELVFLSVRLERFSDGHIRSVETLLRDIVREVVQRVRSADPPIFLVQK